MYKHYLESGQTTARMDRPHRHSRLLPLFLAALMLCSTAALAATDWQSLIGSASPAAVQAASMEMPDGLTLTDNELALYRLGFAQGFDAGQAAQDAQNTQSSVANEKTVWIPIHGGSKYHANASCSNMKSPVEVSLSLAQEKGYTPCQRCHPPIE